MARHEGDLVNAAVHFEASRDALASSAGNGLAASSSILALELGDILEHGTLDRADPALRPTLKALGNADFRLARDLLTTLRDQSGMGPEARRKDLTALADLLQRLVELSRPD